MYSLRWSKSYSSHNDDVMMVLNQYRRSAREQEQLYKKLCTAITEERHSEIRNILQDPGYAPDRVGGEDEWSFLHVAVQGEDMEAIDILLEQDIMDSNIPDSEGLTPLMLAAKEIKIDSFKKLLNDPRVNLKAKTKRNQNCLDLIPAKASPAERDRMKILFETAKKRSNADENVDPEQSIETEKKGGGDGWNYGMIIGNSEYSCKMLSNLPTIKVDRKLVVNRLGNKKTYNIDFSNSEHPAIIDDYTNVEDIIGQVEDFMDEVEEKVTAGRGIGGVADTLFMFFLGHGGKVQGVDCILGVDGKPYPINSILHKILDKKCARKVIMILDCCRNKLDPTVFVLSNKEISKAQDFTDFNNVINIWSNQETHKATDLSGATFSAALDEVLEKNPEGVRTADLEQILNEYWKKMQRSHPKMNRVVYRCDVDLNGDYESMFPC